MPHLHCSTDLDGPTAPGARDTLVRDAGTCNLDVATESRAIELQPCALVQREAQRRGVAPEQVVDEMMRADLAQPKPVDLDLLLRQAAELRAKLPPMDGVALARDSRADLEERGS
jgi:hypothetical protein